MQHHETIACLQAWEERFPVLDWCVNGLHVWPLIRIRLGSLLLAAGRGSGPKVVDGPFQRWRRSLTAAAARVRHSASEIRAVTPVDAVFLGRPANRHPIDGVWCERFSDPIADILEAQGLSSLHLEHRSPETDYRLPRHRPSLVVTGAVARRLFGSGLPVLGSASLEGFEEFAAAVRLLVPASPVSRQWVARRARDLDRVARYFDGVLRRADPLVAFCTVYYSVVGMALCVAARRRGIPAVDVQHGVTLGNPAYEGWSRFPEGGYASLPACFWSWSDADAGPVRAWPATARPAHRAVIGGHPQMALWQSGDPLTESLRARIPARDGARYTILVTLNWSSGFSEELQRLLLAAPADWHWWIRLHPLMDRQRGWIREWCSRELGGRVHVDQPTDLPLPLLLGAADVHLTHNSTVVQEAARLGTPSVVIDRRALDVYTEELRSGWAIFAEEPAAILQTVPLQAARRATLAPPAPYPSWTEMSQAVRDLTADRQPCPTTAAAASCPTPVQG